MKQATRHLWGIDLIRFAAALMVAMFHLTWQEETMAYTAWWGWVGVQIFFVVSGFVIAYSANDTSPVRFIRSRLLRLYPAAWVCGLIALAILSIVNRSQPGLLVRFVNSFLLSPVGPFFVSSYWTLPIEIAFYALILVVLLIGRFAQMERVAFGLCLASGLYNAAVAAQTAGWLGGPSLEFGYDWKNLSLLRHGIYFGIGILIWLWSERRLGWLGATAAAIALGAAGLEIMDRTAELLPLFPGVHVEPAHVLASAAVPTAIWLGFTAAIAWSARGADRLGRPGDRALGWIRAVGLATYPLYLLHEPFGIAARNILMRLGVPHVEAAGAAIMATTALALVVALHIEPVVRRRFAAILPNAGATAEGWRGRLYRTGGAV